MNALLPPQPIQSLRQRKCKQVNEYSDIFSSSNIALTIDTYKYMADSWSFGYVSRRSTSLFRGSNLLKPAVADAEADTISTRM
jgi:hypothetical protein